MIKLLLTLIISSFSFFIVTAQNFVTLHEDCNYSGKQVELYVGNYRYYQMKIGNDELSSLQIPPNLKVIIYEHDNFKGKSKTLYSNVACLPDGWNNNVSSLKVQERYNTGNNGYVTFYKDCYKKGYFKTLNPGVYSGAKLGLLRENISSFSIHGNLLIRAYLNSSFTNGKSYIFIADQNCLSDLYNDKIKSIKIEVRSNNNYYNQQNNGIPYMSGDYASFYSSCSFKGNSLHLKPGTYTGSQLGILKYRISSLKVPSNLRVRAYKNKTTPSGQYYSITNDISCLNSILNDKIGALVIEYRNNTGVNTLSSINERVKIFVDTDYKGQYVTLLPGSYSSMTQIGFPDNALSSLILPEGFRVVLYEEENFGGQSYTINRSKTRFYFSGWNDKTSSIKVYRE
ncbi:MAG: hypothetical protein R2796_11590 [Chitinophagaceae bacterium]